MKGRCVLLCLATMALLPGGLATAAGEPSSKETLRGHLPGGGSVTIEVTFGEKRKYDVSFDRLRMRCDDGSAQRISLRGLLSFDPDIEDPSNFGLALEASEGYFGWRFRGKLRRPDLAIGSVSAHRMKRKSDSVRCSSGRVRWRATPSV